jgi:hypothetical protein
MLDLQSDLKILVSLFVGFDYQNECYSETINEAQRGNLEWRLSRLLFTWLQGNDINLLLTDELKREQITKNYNELVTYFTVGEDKKPMAEIAWLEMTLSNGACNGTCLDLLTSCYQTLITPDNLKQIKLNEHSTRKDLQIWLKGFRENAVTYTERSFYDSLLGLLEQFNGYYDEVGKIKPVGIRALLSFIPMVLVGAGTITFAEQLFAVYALYFILLKSGQFISRSNATELKVVGTALQKVSTVSATATSAILVHLIEMVFFASLQCYSATLQVGSATLSPLLTWGAAEEPLLQKSIEEELHEARKESDMGLTFEHFKLKLIAMPIEARYNALGQQYFLGMRTGNAKRLALQEFLFSMQACDHNPDPIDIKLEFIQELIDQVKKENIVYSPAGKTAEAIDTAERFLHHLQQTESFMQKEESDGSINNELTINHLVASPI